jgi:hypothetical protein
VGEYVLDCQPHLPCSHLDTVINGALAATPPAASHTVVSRGPSTVRDGHCRPLDNLIPLTWLPPPSPQTTPSSPTTRQHPYRGIEVGPAPSWDGPGYSGRGCARCDLPCGTSRNPVLEDVFCCLNIYWAKYFFVGNWAKSFGDNCKISSLLKSNSEIGLFFNFLIKLVHFYCKIGLFCDESGSILQ